MFVKIPAADLHLDSEPFVSVCQVIPNYGAVESLLLQPNFGSRELVLVVVARNRRRSSRKCSRDYCTSQMSSHGPKRYSTRVLLGI